MTPTPLQLGEFHRFEASGQQFLYLVPSAAVFALDPAAAAVIERLEAGPMTPEALALALADRTGDAAIDADAARSAVDELQRVRAIAPAPIEPPLSTQHSAISNAVKPRLLPMIPLSTLVLNVTNQCNLACTYCYEYGEDKLVDTANGRQPKFMTDETARAAVDFMFREAGASRVVHLTFFGGETLLNFPVLRRTVGYARERAAALGKTIDFSLTTNATLLRPEIVEFLVEHDVGVTISIDGPRETQDRFRVFHNGKGSYDVVAPKIRELLARHRGRPIGARVTLTSQTLDVVKIFRHLTDEIGFREVGFAPVTTAPGRSYTIEDRGFDRLLEQFNQLAFEFLECAVEDRHHGFSNVKETIEEIHKGLSKAYPCGAGLGLMGVATDGEVALCHRFAGSPQHRIGSVQGGVDRERQQAFLARHHLDDKVDCSVCWARPLCSGGCYHEAYVRYGDTARPNLHYCDWIRGWTHTCLEVYGALAVRNPGFLQRFEGQGSAARATDDLRGPREPRV